ncbi:MAG: DNA polymerase III subunit delta' [Betaproteobacteria bacterium]|nr:DNA polymerase III subunit delta' [Betaproteobacteria bacterium]
MTLPWLIEPLTQLLRKKDTFPQSLLIHGTSGIGKVEFAHALTQALLCHSPTASGEACQHCQSCDWFSQGQHPDVVVLSLNDTPSDEEGSFAETDKNKDKKTTTITIDAVRQLTPFLTVGAQRGGYKVVLIEQADALNLNAANALLKALEEPPKDVIFILVASELKKLLPTIISRCQKYSLKMPSAKEASEYLTMTESQAQPLLAVYGTPLSVKRALDQDLEKYRLPFLRCLTDPKNRLSEITELALKIPLEYWLDWTHKWCHDLITHYFTNEPYFHTEMKEQLNLQDSSIVFDLLMWEKQLKQAKKWVNHPLVPKLYIESLLIPWLSINQTLHRTH